MTRLPRVVAMVPAWNAAAFIRATLEALSAQTYPNLDILVSVDLSTDDTVAICDAYRRVDPRVQMLRQNERLGFVGNTSRLLREVDGDYVLWAWHDDILLPEYVSSLVPVLERNPGAVCAYTDLELHRLDGRISTLAYSHLDGVSNPYERAKRVLWIPENWWLPNRGLVRREAAVKVGGFRRHWAGEYKSDWPYAVHMAILGEHLRLPTVLCRKFLRMTSLSASWRRNRRANLAAALSCAREIRRSDLSPSEKARLYLTTASVMKAFVQQRYVERQEFRSVEAYHRRAHDRERQLLAQGETPRPERLADHP